MRALYVATDLRDADALQQEVRRAAPKLTFDVCSGTAEARSRIEGTVTYDVIILDSSLPEQDQQQLIEQVRSRQIPPPHRDPHRAGYFAVVRDRVGRRRVHHARPPPGRAPGPGPAHGHRTVSRRDHRLAREQRLKRSEARLRLIIEAMPAGVVLVDQTGKIQAMNLAGAALVGTGGPSDVVGRELYSLADHDGIQALRELVARAFDGERGKAVFTCHSPDGHLRPLQIEALCIQKDAQGQGSVLGVLSAASGGIVAQPPTMEPSEESGVDFAFANDQHSDERMALEQALEEMRTEVARLSLEAATERGRVQQVLEKLERSRATAAEHHAQKNEVEERHRDSEARVAELEVPIGELDARHRDEAGELRGERQKLQKALEDTARRVDGPGEGAGRGDGARRGGRAGPHTDCRRRGQHAVRCRREDEGTDSGTAGRPGEGRGQRKVAQGRGIENIRADAVRATEALEAQSRNSKGAEVTLASARDALQSRLQELEAQSADLETRRPAAVARVAELEEKRRAEQVALASANKHEAELEQQLTAARDEAARAASERDGLKSELGRVHESHRAAEDDAALKASDVGRIKGELEGRIQQLQAELIACARNSRRPRARSRTPGRRPTARAASLTSCAPSSISAAPSSSSAASRWSRSRPSSARFAASWIRCAASSIVSAPSSSRDAVSSRPRAGARDAHAREVDDVKAALAKASGVIDELRQGRDTVAARAHAASGELDALRREVESRGHQAADLQKALDRERADTRERAAETERRRQDALARLMKQIDEAREFHASAAATSAVRASADDGARASVSASWPRRWPTISTGSSTAWPTKGASSSPSCRTVRPCAPRPSSRCRRRTAPASWCGTCCA